MAAYDNPGLQQGNQPSHIESAQGDVFVLGSTLLADNPQLLPTYFKQAGYPPTTLSKLRSFGFGRLNLNGKGIEGPVTGHYEKPRPNELFTVGEIISTSGNEITIALTTDDMVAETNSYGQSFVFSRPRVTEVWQFSDAGAQYRIIEKDRTVNPHQLTLKANADIDPEDEIIEGSQAFYVATVKGEGTGQVEPLRTRQYKYQNTFWITDETDITSGTHMTTAVRFEPVPGSNLLWMEGIKDMEMRHEAAKGKIWMFGAKATGWTDYSDALKSDVPIPGTQGLLDYALENGYDLECDLNDFGEADIRAMSSYFHDIRVGSTEILLMQGYNVNQLIETFWSDKLNYNWVIGLSERYMSEGVRNARKNDNSFTEEGMFINLGVTGFAMGNYTFLQTAAPEFNYMQGAGAVGYKDWMIAAPFGRAGEQADNTPYLGYEFRGTQGYSRENEVWCESGAGTRAITGKSDFLKTSQVDANRTYLRSEIAPHFALGEQFIVFHPQGASAS